jgi:hypothetical protein
MGLHWIVLLVVYGVPYLAVLQAITATPLTQGIFSLDP